jgi:hypothetical protein
MWRKASRGAGVIENHCVKIEHGRFFEDWLAGVNTKVISAKRSSAI